jgi:hypothetical protein
MRRLAWIALLACFLLAEGVAGIRPRDDSTDYPAHESTGGVTLAAVLLSVISELMQRRNTKEPSAL